MFGQLLSISPAQIRSGGTGMQSAALGGYTDAHMTHTKRSSVRSRPSRHSIRGRNLARSQSRISKTSSELGTRLHPPINLNEDIMLPLVKRLLENADKSQPDTEGALQMKEVGNAAYKVRQ